MITNLDGGSKHPPTSAIGSASSPERYASQTVPLSL
jgi:hypothetical protein